MKKKNNGLLLALPQLIVGLSYILFRSFSNYRMVFCFIWNREKRICRAG